MKKAAHPAVIGDKVQGNHRPDKYPVHPRRHGSYVRFDGNACVLIDKEGNPRAERASSALRRRAPREELAIVSLASEVV
ncbi:MAG: uL14 family ribosomal protein [Phycisphaerales bacterium]